MHDAHTAINPHLLRYTCQATVGILLGVFSLELFFLNSLTLFSDGSLPPVAEKSLKGLGKGSGGEPFSKRVSPSCSTRIPRQILIYRATQNSCELSAGVIFFTLFTFLFVTLGFGKHAAAVILPVKSVLGRKLDRALVAAFFLKIRRQSVHAVYRCKLA